MPACAATSLILMSWWKLKRIKDIAFFKASFSADNYFTELKYFFLSLSQEKTPVLNVWTGAINNPNEDSTKVGAFLSTDSIAVKIEVNTKKVTTILYFPEKFLN